MADNKFADRKFTEICSERTLQTDKEGFFLTFADEVAKSIGDNWVKSVFGKLKSDKERIRIIYQHPPMRDLVVDVLSNVREVYRKKCAEMSRQRRKEAEEWFRKGEGKKALMLYGQSVLKAPTTGSNAQVDNGSSLALSLWGRSEVLVALNEYSLALSDVQASLKEHLPDDHKADAYARMATCYRELGEENKAKVALSLTEKLAKDAAKLTVLRKNFDKNARKGTNKEKDRTCVRKTERVLPPITGKQHSEFKYASSKVALKKTKEMGRHLVANEEIATGDALVVEPAYSGCLLPEKFGSHCHHCFERLLSPVGCPDCSSVAFCNPGCRDSALSTYHRHECRFLDLLIGSGMSILSHTALRMVTQNTLERSLDIYENRTKEAVYSLSTNSGKRGAGDFLQRTLMAAFLLRCLQKSGYFGKRGDSIEDDVIPTEKEYRIGELLLFHLQMLQFNAHEIYETVHCSDHRFKGARPSYIGVAVYPTVALFNHECYPAVTRHFVGKHIVITALRPLNPGDLIAENYGPVFTWRSLVERQRSLSARYWFGCRCRACVEDWPSLNGGLDSVARRLKCPNKGCSYLFSLPVTKPDLECPSCHHQVRLGKNIDALKLCETHYDLGLELMNSEQPLEAIQVLSSAIDTFHRISSPPHKETHLAQEVLRACLADSGNRYPGLVKPKK